MKECVAPAAEEGCQQSIDEKSDKSVPLLSECDPDGPGKVEFEAKAAASRLRGARTASKLKLRASPTILERLKDDLVKQGVRYTDILALYDDDGDGKVTKQQWRRALAAAQVQTGQARASCMCGACSSMDVVTR